MHFLNKEIIDLVRDNNKEDLVNNKEDMANNSREDSANNKEDTDNNNKEDLGNRISRTINRISFNNSNNLTHSKITSLINLINKTINSNSKITTNFRANLSNKQINLIPISISQLNLINLKVIAAKNKETIVLEALKPEKILTTNQK